MFATMLPGLILVAAAPTLKDPPKKDANLVGEWILDSATMGGKPLPYSSSSRRVTFRDDGIVIVKEGDDLRDEQTYRIDPNEVPARIDLTPVPERKASAAGTGIYKIEGDVLTLCIAIGKTRPKSFESAEGATTLLMTLRRAK